MRIVIRNGIFEQIQSVSSQFVWPPTLELDLFNRFILCRCVIPRLPATGNKFFSATHNQCVRVCVLVVLVCLLNSLFGVVGQLACDAHMHVTFLV